MSDVGLYSEYASSHNGEPYEKWLEVELINSRKKSVPGWFPDWLRSIIEKIDTAIDQHSDDENVLVGLNRARNIIKEETSIDE